MKQIIVGTYGFGGEFVQVVLREGTGGDFYTNPELGSVPRVKIGADHGNWHEVFEFAYMRAGLRFSPMPSYPPYNSADWLFIMDHQQFHNCTARCAELLQACVPDLAIAWKKWNQPKKPKARKRKRKRVKR